MEESQRQGAKMIAAALEENALSVPGIQRLSVGPKYAELRYFRKMEKEEAESIGTFLESLGVDLKVVYFPGYETSTNIRPRHYELWFSEKDLK